MSKFYKPKEDWNEQELRTGKASYGSVVKRYFGDLVLCNNIANIDDSIFDNIIIGSISDNTDIFQYFLCDLTDWEKEKLREIEEDCPMLIGYSDMLDLYVLMVTHYGTSWDYVSTDIELTDNFDETDL